MISIGNISMGGRGKTPLAGLVARLLVEAGERPAILSRGYGRAIADAGVTVVSDGSPSLAARASAKFADLAHSGDEPLMLARAVPGAAVLVCDDRALAGTLAETALGCTVHILDDGFQHHRLRRDVDIVLVAPEDFNDKVMPFGRLREPIDALKDADGILIDGNDQMGQWGNGAMNRIASLPHCLTAPLSPSFSGVLLRKLGTPTPPLAPGSRVVAVAGIASPSRFFDMLKDGGWSLAETMPFGDHHPFSAADARRIAEAATRTGAAAIVTTSKDAIRLEGLGPWPVPLVEMPLEVSVEPADQFRAWLLGRIKIHR